MQNSFNNLLKGLKFTQSNWQRERVFLIIKWSVSPDAKCLDLIEAAELILAS